MRFASRFGAYKHGARGASTRVIGHDNVGQPITSTVVQELRAEFVEARYLLTEDEIMQAITSMVHTGLPIDRDTEEHVSARSRISGYDTEIAQQEQGWTDEEREIVEQALLKSVHLGSDHILLKATAVPVPWPNYDTDDLETIKLIATRAGLVDAVRAYERQNANRPEIFELFTEPEAEEPLVVDAS